MIRRAADVALATLILVLTSPIQAATAFVVLLELGRPVLFRQTRAGRAGTTFEVVKFRSMHPQPAQGPSLPDDARTSAWGRIIRRFRFDELPQVFLILQGKMSMVGPRPLYPSGHRPENAELFDRRHRVRPGFTGWAQVNGNTLLEEREKLALDVFYVDHASLGFDLRILWMTVLTVIGGEKRHEANIERALIHADRSGRHG